MKRRAMWMLTAGVLLAGLCAGCQEKFTRQRYETIYIGQPAFAVERTLGEPAVKFSDSWSYLHEEPFYKAVIAFKDGRVTDKAWYDEKEMGDHPDARRRSDKNQPDARQTTIVVE